MSKELRPASLEEALSLRRSSGAEPLAGGTAERRQGAEAFLYLDGCEEFRRMDTDGSLVHIGAGCSFTRLREESLTPENLRQAAGLCPEELQGQATLGGAVFDPASAAAVTLMAMDARLLLASETGRRSMGIRSFYRRRGPNLAGDELLCEILVPQHSPKHWQVKLEGSGAERLSFAAVLRRKNGRIHALTAAFGGLEPGRISRFPEFEEEMLGLTNSEAGKLREEFLAAYARYLPAAGSQGEQRRERCVAWLRAFLDESSL